MGNSQNCPMKGRANQRRLKTRPCPCRACGNRGTRPSVSRQATEGVSAPSPSGRGNFNSHLPLRGRWCLGSLSRCAGEGWGEGEFDGPDPHPSPLPQGEGISIAISRCAADGVLAPSPAARERVGVRVINSLSRPVGEGRGEGVAGRSGMVSAQPDMATHSPRSWCCVHPPLICAKRHARAVR